MAVITRIGYQGVGLATITGTGSLSDALALYDTRVCAFLLPASINSAVALTFQGSWDGTTFTDIYKPNGDELVYVVVASRWVTVQDGLDFAGVSYIKVRTGTAAAPTAQSGGCVISVVTQSL